MKLEYTIYLLHRIQSAFPLPVWIIAVNVVFIVADQSHMLYQSTYFLWVSFYERRRQGLYEIPVFCAAYCAQTENISLRSRNQVEN